MSKAMVKTISTDKEFLFINTDEVRRVSVDAQGNLEFVATECGGEKQRAYKLSMPTNASVVAVFEFLKSNEKHLSL